MHQPFYRKKILVVAAHPDDEILGAAGTVNKLTTEQECIASALILSKGVASRHDVKSREMEKQILTNEEDVNKATKKAGYESANILDYPDNQFDTVSLLEIIRSIEGLVSDFNPDVVFTHHLGDLNIDHRISSQAVFTALRPLREKKPIIASFETPSSTEWQFPDTNLVFNPNLFIPLTKKNVKAKMEAIKAYRNEIRAYPHPRSAEALEVIAKKWGTVIGADYAEAFKLHRWIL